jgi:hypothetical protein
MRRPPETIGRRMIVPLVFKGFHLYHCLPMSACDPFKDRHLNQATA